MFAAGIDSMVPAFAREGIWLFVFLFVVVLFRAQLTYWLARGAASGAVRANGRQGFVGAVARWFDGPIPRKGAAIALIAMLIAAKIAWGRRKRHTVNAALAADSADNG